MSNKPTYDILIDFDDVIYPFCRGVMQVLKEEGIEGKITQWDMHKDFGMERDELWDILGKPKHAKTLYMQPFDPEPLDQLRRLKYAGHRLHLVTARSTEASQYYCMQSLRAGNVAVKTVDFDSDKAKYVHIYDASFSIDDSFAIHQSYPQKWHASYLMTRSHNVSEKAHRRVHSVTEFADIIQRAQADGVQMRGEEG